MRVCCRPPTPTPGCTAATVGCRRSLSGPRSASCSSECHRQCGQQFGGDGYKKSFHLAPAYHRGHLPCLPGFAAHLEAPVRTNSPGAGWVENELDDGPRPDGRGAGPESSG